MILHIIILIFFTLLIIIHLLNLSPIIEGAEFDTSKYTDNNLGNDPLYLARLNAANITYLKGRIDDVSKLRQEVQDLSGSVHANAIGITEMNKHLSGISAGISGRKPDSKEPIPQATGLF